VSAIRRVPAAGRRRHVSSLSYATQ
jgi:hypothetical protein